jgi:hypothetical protein
VISRSPGVAIAAAEVFMVAVEAFGAFEAMASPRDLLQALEATAGRRLPLSVGGVADARDGDDDGSVDAPLRRHWLIDGGVVELCALPGAFALTAALRLARQARARARAHGRPRHLAVVDPTATLCAPALAHVLHGNDGGDDDDDAFAETLVVRPGPTGDAVFSCAQRIVESGAVAAVVVDAAHLRDLSAAVVPARRLLLAAEAAGVVVALVTSPLARRPLPLPVAARADVDVDAQGRPRLQARRHRHGLPPTVVVDRPLSVSEGIAAGLRTVPPSPTTTTPRPALELVAWS